MDSLEIEQGNEDAVYVKKRFSVALDTLLSYARALGQVREESLYNLEEYGNGMYVDK